MAPPGQSSSQPLPAKELTLFRKIVKCYEHKQYRAGLKCAKQILANPKLVEHGETLAMKGLILNCMGKHEEAHDCVKRGLRADIRSHVCWHVFGLLARADKKYDEAIKAYRNALRIDKDNMQILRDLSLLQIQMRDLDGYRDTRYQLLTLRPTQRASWIGYATAYHLLRDYDMALKIVNEFCNNNKPADYDFEQSELLLYQNMILRESGQLQLALEKLEENSAHIVDRLSYMEIRGDLLIQLGKWDAAEKVYWQLIDRNPENLDYYNRLERCRARDETELDLESRRALYADLQVKKPRASAPRRIPLTFLTGAAFEKALTPFVIAGLRKGVPSLFKSLAPLYSDPDKIAIIEQLLLQFVKRLEEKGYSNGTLDGTGQLESPTTALWLYYFLAQHYNRLGATAKAHQYIDRALQHTPTLIELLMVKAKICKNAGNPEEAARLMEQAQELDTADRYVNSKCAKYLLRAGLVADAEAMCGKFTRDGVNATQNLNEMQCMWYETECAKAYRRLNRPGEALKKCHEVERHFIGIVEDQFDFHTYCVRKMTLCAYIGLLRLEDVLRRHGFYYAAAKIAIKIYLRLHDCPEEFNGEHTDGDRQFTAAELRKQKRKMNKQKATAQTDAGEKAKQSANPAKKTDTETDGGQSVEPLDPVALLKVEKPLDEACKFVQPLMQLGCREIGAYILGFEVYLRKGKMLLMLQCLDQAARIDPGSPRLHVCRVKFLKFFAERGQEEGSGAVGELTREVLPRLFPNGMDGEQLNARFKQAHLSSFVHRLAVAEASIVLDPKTTDACKCWLMKSLDEEGLNGLTWKTAKRFLHAIARSQFGQWSADETRRVVRRCQQLFRECTVFGVSEETTESAAVNGTALQEMTPV